MKQLLSFLCVIILSTCITSCEEGHQNNTSINVANLVSKFGGELTSGSVRFQTSKASEIVVTQDFLEDKENSVERLYVIGLENDVEETFSGIFFEKGDIININNNALVIHGEDGMWIILTVNNANSKKIKKDITQFLGKSIVHTFEGTYLSFIKDKFDFSHNFLKEGSVFDGLERFSRNYQEVIKKSNIEGGRIQLEGDGAVDICTKTCSSGGPGSTSCSTSATIGIFTTTCSVTASDGYYACCNNFYNKCKACKNSPS